MPNKDGTGPMGFGPMTGRGLGNCLNLGLPALVGIVAGFCFGRGRGWRNRFQSTEVPVNQGFISDQDELSVLKRQAENLEGSLSSIKQRITELEHGN